MGAVVGGLVGRVAMRLIAIWTEPLTQVTLTGNRVGEITLGGTLDLMLSTAEFGALLGLVYVAIRRWLPPSNRPLSYAAFTLVVPGGIFLGDKEFELFDPPLLAAVLFLPAFPLCGLALAALIERVTPSTITRPSGRSQIVLGAVLAIGLAAAVTNLARLT